MLHFARIIDVEEEISVAVTSLDPLLQKLTHPRSVVMTLDDEKSGCREHFEENLQVMWKDWTGWNAATMQILAKAINM